MLDLSKTTVDVVKKMLVYCIKKISV